MRATINFNHFDDLIEDLEKLTPLIEGYWEAIEKERARVPEPIIKKRWILKFLKPKVIERKSYNEHFGDRADEYVEKNWWMNMQDEGFGTLASLVNSWKTVKCFQEVHIANLKTAIRMQAANVQFTSKDVENFTFWLGQIEE